MDKESSLNAFERFLAALDPDRDRAGSKYEQLRNKLIRYFAFKGNASPEDLADETLNRVVRRLTDREEIEDVQRYAYAMATFVVKEHQRMRVEPLDAFPEVPSTGEEEEEGRHRCLDLCLQKLSPQSRELILDYYQGEKAAKIEHRKELAERLGLTLNSLRLKAYRIRASLERCTRECLENTDPKGPS